MTHSISLAQQPFDPLTGLSRWAVRAFWRVFAVAVVAVLMFPELALAQPQVHAVFVPKTWRVGADPLPMRVQVQPGTQPVTSLRVNWQLNDGPVSSSFFSASELAQQGYPILVELSGELNIEQAGEHRLQMWFSDVSGGADAGDTLTLMIPAFENDFDRHVLLEEFTGAWCGWCPDGMEAVEKLMEAYPGRIIPVMIHNNDGMSFEEGDQITSFANASGFPSAQIDRTTFPGQLVAPAIYRDLWEAAAEAQLRAASRATFDMDVSYDSRSREITVDMTSTFLSDFTGSPRFGLHLLEDSLMGSGTGWDQANYTDGNPSSKWYRKGNPMREFAHRHVLRAVPGGVRGITGVIPDTVESGETFTHRLTFERPRGMQVNRTSVVGFVYNESGSTRLREIFHADEKPIVQGVSRNAKLSTVFDAGLRPNPASDRAVLSFRLENAQVARYAILDLSGRELRSAELGQLAAGGHEQGIDLQGLSAGVYLVALTAGTHTHVQRLVVR